MLGILGIGYFSEARVAVASMSISLTQDLQGNRMRPFGGPRADGLTRSRGETFNRFGYIAVPPGPDTVPRCGS